MTDPQRVTMKHVIDANGRAEWYRAASHGERVVLAGLFRRGILARRVWRKGKIHADDAHEYKLAKGSNVSDRPIVETNTTVGGICAHERTRPGKPVPRRWGSYATKVCASCGAFQTWTQGAGAEPVGPWRDPADYEAETAEMELH